jgi:hypothetical protein
MGAELGGPVLVALFYLPLLSVTCADGAFIDRAFTAGAFIKLVLSLNSACVDSGLVSRVVATFGAPPRSQVRYTLAMRFY